MQAMRDAEYEYECSRAELLGLPKPTKEEFLSRKVETSDELQIDESELTAEQVEEIGARTEGLTRITGGLDELNNILASTQKKIHRFKTVCGSFSNILKLHVANKKDESEASTAAANQSSSVEEMEVSNVEQSTEAVAGAGPGPDTVGALKSTTDSPRHYIKADSKSEISKLDSIIKKAEKAELSLSSQNKQMKKFLN